MEQRVCGAVYVGFMYALRGIVEREGIPLKLASVRWGHAASFRASLFLLFGIIWGVILISYSKQYLQ